LPIFKDPPSPEPSDAARNFAAPAENASETIMSHSYAPVIQGPKVPTPVNSSEESDGETNA
jgi:hypothetical protein